MIIIRVLSVVLAILFALSCGGPAISDSGSPPERVENLPPVITSEDYVFVTEDSLFVQDVDANDPNGDPVLRFSIDGGPDSALFSIDSTSGSVSFRDAPVYTAPEDANGDNIYQFTVEVSDGSLIDRQDIIVIVQLADRPRTPIPADLWAPDSTADIPDTGTCIYLYRDPGDRVGGGDTYYYDRRNTIMEVYVDDGGSLLHFVIEDDWEGTFVAMETISRLEVGYYPYLNQYSDHNPVRGGILWATSLPLFLGSDRNGWFVIDEIIFGEDQLQFVSLRFMQQSDESDSVLYGYVRWDANDATQPDGPINPIPDDLWEPDEFVSIPETGTFVYLESQSGDYIGGGQNYAYDKTSNRISVIDNGNRISIHVDGWTGRFQAMHSLNRVQQGYYPNLTRYHNHNWAIGGLSWSGQGRNSNTLNGWFTVDQISFDNDRLESVTIRFEQHSEGAIPALFGYIRWERDEPIGPNVRVNPTLN